MNNHDLPNAPIHARRAARRPVARHRVAAGVIAALSLLGAACSTDDTSVSDTTAGDATSGATPKEATPVEQRVTMRDGVELATYVYLPDGPGPFPTLVLRTPYGLPLTPIGGFQDDDALEETGLPDEEVGWPLVTDEGFALVVQETRGTGASGGANSALTTEGPDGYDAVEWVADQSWSNGRIGIMGDSAAGVAAALAAAEQPPSLDALYTQNASHSLIDDLTSPGGAVRVESIVAFTGGQMLELGDDHFDALGLEPSEFDAAIERLGGDLATLAGGVGEPMDAGWAQLDRTALPEVAPLIPAFEQYLTADPELRERLDTIGDIDVPVLAVSMWHDVFARSTFDAALDAQSRGADFRLLSMPGSHYDIDEPENWPVTPMLDFFGETLADGDRTIDGFNWQAVGSDELESSEVWPPAAADRLTLLLSDGTLGSEAGSGTASFTSDPADPVVTNAGMSLVAASGTGDNPSLAAPGRDDLVWFDSAVLDAGLRLRGSAELTVEVTTDAPSVDLSARLLAVAPDGSSELVRSAHLRSDAPAGATGPLVIEFGDLAFDLEAGSVLRLELTGSDFPAWSLNPQNGDSNPLEATVPVAASISVDLASARLALTTE